MGYNPKEGCANLLFWASLPRNLYEIFKKWGGGGQLVPSALLGSANEKYNNYCYNSKNKIMCIHSFGKQIVRFHVNT